jgi:Uma2 family endonuclease
MRYDVESDCRHRRPSMAVTPARMTLAEFLDLPEVKPARELRRGMVSQKVPPSGPHSSLQSWFGAQVYNLGELREIAQAFTEARVIVGKDTYVPDVVVYLWERIPQDENGDLPFYFTTPPDLVVEILSPGQTVRPQLERCRELIGHGVRVVLLADPERRNAYLLRADREVGPLIEGNAIDLSDVLPEFPLTVSDLMARVRPRPPRRPR